MNKSIDWTLFVAVIFISIAGIITMNSFVEVNDFSQKQIVWLIFSSLIMLIASIIDWRFMKRTEAVTFIFIILSFN